MTNEIITPKRELILQVEDEAAIRNIIPRVFKPYGVDVESAKGFEEGIVALRGERADFSGVQNYTGLLLDIRLHGRKVGHELATYAIQLGFDHTRYPIIMFSGADLVDAQEGTKHICGLHWLQKPATTTQIVETYLTNRRDAQGRLEFFSKSKPN